MKARVGEGDVYLRALQTQRHSTMSRFRSGVLTEKRSPPCSTMPIPGALPAVNIIGTNSLNATLETAPPWGHRTAVNEVPPFMPANP